MFQPFIHYLFYILTNNISLHIWNCEVYSTIFVEQLANNIKLIIMKSLTTNNLTILVGLLFAIIFLIAFIFGYGYVAFISFGIFTISFKFLAFNYFN